MFSHRDDPFGGPRDSQIAARELLTGTRPDALRATFRQHRWETLGTDTFLLFSAFVSALVKSHFLQIACGGTGETEFQRLEREERELRDELRSHRLWLSSAHNLIREQSHSRSETW